MGVTQIRTKPKRDRTRLTNHIGLLSGAKPEEVNWQPLRDIEIDASIRGWPETWVYVISCEGHNAVKVGYSNDPLRRLRNFQSGTPARLRLEVCLYGGRYLESWFHRVLEGGRIPWTKEWFGMDAESRAIITEHALLGQLRAPMGATFEEMETAAMTALTLQPLEHAYMTKPLSPEVKAQNKAARQGDRMVRRAGFALERLNQPSRIGDPIDRLEELAADALALTEALKEQVAVLRSIRYESDRGGEQIRGELTAYLSAMNTAEKVLASIVRLDLDSRRLRVAEAQAALFVIAIHGILGELGVGDDPRLAELVHKHLSIAGTAEEVP